MNTYWPSQRFQIKSGKGPFKGKWWVYSLIAGPNGYRVHEALVGGTWKAALEVVTETIAKGQEEAA